MTNKILGISMIATYLCSVTAYYLGSYSEDITAYDLAGDLLIYVWIGSVIWGAIRLIKSKE
jgi:hypothetical protein